MFSSFIAFSFPMIDQLLQILTSSAAEIKGHTVATESDLKHNL